MPAGQPRPAINSLLRLSVNSKPENIFDRGRLVIWSLRPVRHNQVVGGTMKKSTIKRLDALLFALACVGAYGGAVNQGGFGIFPGLPFFGFLVYFASRQDTRYRKAAIVTLCILGALYGLKHLQTPVFQPLVGEEVRLAEDACWLRYDRYATGEVDLAVYPKGLCGHNSEYIEETGALPAGQVLMVTAVSVSHADFGERYAFTVDTEYGSAKVYPDKLSAQFQKLNGDPVVESDLRRGIFYYPSLLMYWALVPVILLGMLG